MNLRSGFPLLHQQFKALFRKNLLLSWRNKRATFLQLFSSFFFIFLIFCIQKAIDARNASSTAFESVANPPALAAPPIPPCEDKYYIKTPCFDFVWSGSDSARIQRIVGAIRDNNPGRPIPPGKVRRSLNFRCLVLCLASEKMGEKIVAAIFAFLFLVLIFLSHVSSVRD